MIMERCPEKQACTFCSRDAKYKAGDTFFCILHFSQMRNEMMGYVVHDHAFATRGEDF